MQVLPTLPSCTYDGVLTDSPYGLGFMGHTWDGEVPPVIVWQHLLRACKPGAYLLAFGGAKTFHRLACNIEDAGWEIRDCLCWLYGEGFPKNHNISKAIGRKAQRWGGYLARLILQPKRMTPRRLLVPFSGSGSEMLAGLLAGWDHITGIELRKDYVRIAIRRLSELDSLADSA
jgi:DNA modification methylase